MQLDSWAFLSPTQFSCCQRLVEKYRTAVESLPNGIRYLCRAGALHFVRVTPQIVALTQRSEAEGVGLGAGRGRCKRRAGCTGRVAVALRLIEHPQRLEQHRLRAVGDGARALAALEVDLERAVGPGDHLVHRLFAG